MPGADFFLLRKGRDLLVVARLDVLRRHGIDDVLLEIGTVQLALGQIVQPRLELRALVEFFGGGILGEQLDVDGTGKRGHPLLVVRQLRELRVQIGDGDVELGLVDLETTHLGDDRISLVLGHGRQGESDRGGEGERGKFMITRHGQNPLTFAGWRVSVIVVANQSDHHIVAILVRPIR